MDLEATQGQSAPAEESVTQEQTTDEVVVGQAAAPADEADAAFEQGFDSARGLLATPRMSCVSCWRMPRRCASCASVRPRCLARSVL